MHSVAASSADRDARDLGEDKELLGLHPQHGDVGATLEMTDISNGNSATRASPGQFWALGHRYWDMFTIEVM